MNIEKILEDAGVDINVGQYVVFDDKDVFLAQTNTVAEAFAIADANNVRCPALVNLDELREHNYVFHQSPSLRRSTG